MNWKYKKDGDYDYVSSTTGLFTVGDWFLKYAKRYQNYSTNLIFNYKPIDGEIFSYYLRFTGL